MSNSSVSLIKNCQIDYFYIKTSKKGKIDTE